ncbi:bifunctional epoxide hydrolase [Acrasis kona]|uniref:Bifunctional epoxide hydrolase n=1 Tax=Acrasis kona TaxID=1008807 RepID=A0AAW2YSN4_9EUKA
MKYPHQVVIFDLGGVVLSSPHEGLTEYETELNLPKYTLGKLLNYNDNDGDFAKLERNEISFNHYCTVTEEKFSKLHNQSGQQAFSAKRMVEKLEKYSSTINLAVVEVIANLRSLGIVTCALTNNWYNIDSEEVLSAAESYKLTTSQHKEMTTELRNHFDHFFESREMLLRKPQSLIYKKVLDALNVDAKNCIYLDDIGQNLKPMRELGAKTILVKNVEEALKELKEYYEIK